MKEDEKVSHLMKGVAEDIYQSLLTREINDTASFIKWCNYIEDMKQKRVGRPRFARLPNVVPVASLTDETDLVSLIRTIVREEVHRLVNQTADPQYVVTDPRRHIADPVSRQAVGARKTKESDLPGGEAACTGNPPSTAKMTGNQLDVIIDKSRYVL
ncbi:transposon Ty3-I Gag-Pol polyprotein [Trichonephila clavipes]|nr:transposon Ty3-I Gag-Pol polyprotein [Trichonephila clavipes]